MKLSEYVVALKPTHCEFGNVYGVRDQALKKKLLDEPELTYQKVITIVEAWVATRLSLEAEKNCSSGSQAVNYVQQKKYKKEKPGKPVNPQNKEQGNRNKVPEESSGKKKMFWLGL